MPWQLAGFEVDAVPLTPDGQIDLDAAEAMLTEQHRVVAFAHVSNVLGSILDAKRAAEIAHSKGALLLLDGCQAVPRLGVNVVTLAPTSTPSPGTSFTARRGSAASGDAPNCSRKCRRGRAAER